MDCSSPGSSIHGILQARILEQVAIPFFSGSSWPRDQTQVSRTTDSLPSCRFFTFWATREAILYAVSIIHIHQSQSPNSSHRSPSLLSYPYIYSFVLCGSVSDLQMRSLYTFFLDSHIRFNIQYLFFSFWLSPLCMTESRSIHLSTNDPVLFLFMAKYDHPTLKQGNLVTRNRTQSYSWRFPQGEQLGTGKAVLTSSTLMTGRGCDPGQWNNAEAPPWSKRGAPTHASGFPFFPPIFYCKNFQTQRKVGRNIQSTPMYLTTFYR